MAVSFTWLPVVSVQPEKVERQVKHLLKDQIKHQKEFNISSFVKLMRAFAQPTGYKPFLLLFVLFGFQQASGTLIILTYGVSLFQVSVGYIYCEKHLEKYEYFLVILF